MPDSIGRGESEEEVLTSETQEVVDRLTSQGFIRSGTIVTHSKIRPIDEKKIPPYKNMAEGDLATLEQKTVDKETISSFNKLTQTSDLQTDRVREARLRGYEGDACGDCGNFTLVRNGTCLKCNTCGATSGCS